MLVPPDLTAGAIGARLRAEYGVRVASVTFLPLGADPHSAVYRIVADDGTAYFLKLRRGPFAEAGVAVPRFLHNRGIAPVSAPLATGAGRLWTRVGDFTASVAPFIAGRNGFEEPISARGWAALGAALGGMHRATLPPALAALLPREDFGPRWREALRAFVARAEADTFAEPVVARLAATLRAERATIARLVGRAEMLAAGLRARPPANVLCHADIHAGNVVIDDAGALHIVDWDTAMLAPKERDLMFIGAGIGDDWRGPGPEALFYEGYGEAAIDRAALAYYRCERIVEDLAVFCEELLPTDAGGPDREVSLGFVLGQFAPDGVIAIALGTGWGES